METPKIAFKGFKSDLSCRNEKFELGIVYTKENQIEKPKLCSQDGWHYCNTLKQVFTHYSFDGKNRFFEIEVLGSFTEDEHKGITTSFKIIREVTQEAQEERTAKNLKLETVKEILDRNPLASIGGSIALFLHGISLKRFLYEPVGDIDIIMPYWSPLKGGEDAGDVYDLEEVDGRSAGNDYDACYLYDDETKVDVKINPKQKYERVKYNGYEYRISPLEIIMEAKWRYALNGQYKHKQDCYEISGKKKISS